MKSLLALCTVIATLSAGPAWAQSAQPAQPNSQQTKMAECNKAAEGKKGDARKAFMSKCLSAKPKASEKQLAQQERMKTCNQQAEGKTGDARKAFMKECLSTK